MNAHKHIGPHKDKVVNTLIDRFRDRLRLWRWKIEWQWTFDARAEYLAQVFPTPTVETASIVIRAQGNEDFDCLRYSIAHEMVHIAFEQTAHAVEEMNENAAMSDGAFKQFFGHFLHVFEIEVDNLAKCLCSMTNDDDLNPEEA